MQVEQALEDGALVVACSPNGLEGGAALEKPALALDDVDFGLVEGADGGKERVVDVGGGGEEGEQAGAIAGEEDVEEGGGGVGRS